MENKVYFFTELKPEKVSVQIPNYFFKQGLCEEENDHIKFKITGFLVSQQNTFVIFPKGIFKSENASQNYFAAQTLFKALLKYNKKSIQKFHINFGENNEDGSLLSLINWIVEDYKRYGLIRREFKKKDFNGNTKINWSKTIKETTPYIINGKFLYLDTISIKSLRSLNNEITTVQYLILKDIEEEYGWLLNFKTKHSPNLLNNKYTYERMRFILNNALKVTFNQKELTLYKRLLNYVDIKLKETGKSHFQLLYTKYYQYIWEALCKQLFDDNSNLKDLLPKPYWKVNSEFHETEQIPDILTEDGLDNLYIIDAKYYRSYDGINNLPGWKDIVKQLFYAKSIDRSKFKKIYNVFVFPSPDSDRNSNLLKHGISSVTGKESEFGEIYSFNLNSLYAMHCYVQNEQGNVKQKLLNYLDNKKRDK
ncbi:LlaJI family restriction endonuclease [Bacillus pseudomycoides]|uniref:LlaJI family restriction endonuclease n=1 Tax=Bacillus pseudomycoides TaxID=64104 RepID=UPI000BF48309|nr:LlaJI family restriction endonuclease [Bacillus pseudomycoides]PFY91636.1 hypothetical protein COL53_11480 [Bacillus pseudomycoides]